MDALMRTLLYGGLEKTTYEKYENIIIDYNTRNLIHYLIVSGMGFLVLAAASLITNIFTRTNAGVYFWTGVALLLLLAVQQIIRRCGFSHSLLNSVFISLFILILYAESAAVSFQHPDLPAVTFIGVLLMLPLIFAQRPLHTIISQVLCIIVFLILVQHYKLPEIAVVDTWNAITFLAVSFLAITLITPIHIRYLVQAQIIRELSETDILTGLKNRNSFENDCHVLAKSTPRPICVYADADCLHELNNDRGHEAGDAMLRRIAEKLQEAFAGSPAYRIGGDEFIVFSFDHTLEDAEKAVEELSAGLRSEGYHVSFGCSRAEITDEALDKIVRRAEARMFEAKSAWYALSENSRKYTR